MPNIYILVAVLSFFSACQKEQRTMASDQLHWNRITIKAEGSIGALYGNIVEQMIVSTDRNILKTTDTGKTWRTVARNVDQIREFTTREDTLFAISDGKDYFSVDHGDAWQLLVYDKIRVYNLQIITSVGHLYKVVPRSYGENALPSEVLFSSDQGVTWQNVFPFKHYITAIYSDKQDNIYLGVFGVTWNESQKTFIQGSLPVDAIIYYAKGK